MAFFSPPMRSSRRYNKEAFDNSIGLQIAVVCFSSLAMTLPHTGITDRHSPSSVIDGGVNGLRNGGRSRPVRKSAVGDFHHTEIFLNPREATIGFLTENHLIETLKTTRKDYGENHPFLEFLGGLPTLLPQGTLPSNSHDARVLWTLAAGNFWNNYIAGHPIKLNSDDPTSTSGEALIKTKKFHELSTLDQKHLADIYYLEFILFLGDRFKVAPEKVEPKVYYYRFEAFKGVYDWARRVVETPQYIKDRYARTFRTYMAYVHNKEVGMTISQALPAMYCEPKPSKFGGLEPMPEADEAEKDV